MKLYLEDDKAKIEIKEIASINKDSNILFFMLERIERDSAIEQMEYMLSNKTGKKCIVLDGRYSKVLSM